ncbi:MAG: hypothetical protein WAX04_13825 [Oscillospiraceae bacterium]
MQVRPRKSNMKQTKATSNADIVNAIINQAPSPNDPNGSYTGKPLNPYEVPVQDQDDL